jgi:hypothetical protein
MGFAGKEHIPLAEKLIAEPPKERFDRVILDKKIDSRDKHLKYLRRLVKQVREQDQLVDEKYALWQKSSAAKKNQGQARTGISQGRQKAPEHVCQILLQAKGHRGDDYGN